jgi:hypothetical protein
MTATRKNAIPGLIINAVISAASGVIGYMLLDSVLKNGFEGVEFDTSGNGEMGLVLLLVVGMVYVAAALPLVYSIWVGLSGILKLFQLLTGKWGFAVVAVIFDCIWLMTNLGFFSSCFGMPSGWIAAIFVLVLVALSVVSVVFDFKTFVDKNQD